MLFKKQYPAHKNLVSYLLQKLRRISRTSLRCRSIYIYYLGVVDPRDSPAHPCGEVSAGGAEADHVAARHVLATVVTHSLHNLGENRRLKYIKLVLCKMEFVNIELVRYCADDFIGSVLNCTVLAIWTHMKKKY